MPLLYEPTKSDLESLYVTRNLRIIDVANHYGCSYSQMGRILKKFGVEKSAEQRYENKSKESTGRYKQSYKPLDRNDPAVAWVAGWIASDGHMPSRGYSIKISLQARDADVLQKIAASLGINQPATIQNSVASLYFGGKQLANFFHQEFSIPQGAKSFTLKPPIGLSDEALRLYIRGVFEGDGCVYVHSKLRYQCRISLVSASEEFIHFLQTSIQEHAGVAIPLFNKTETLFELATAGAKALKFLDWLYDGHDILRLERKHDKYLELKRFWAH